jgi:hypothetical protein
VVSLLLKHALRDEIASLKQSINAEKQEAEVPPAARL